MTDMKRISWHGYTKTVRTVLIVFIMLSFLNVFFVPDCDAMLFFHKRAYKGRIIDMETKAPIEGVVVVTVYRIDSILGSPAGGWDKKIHVQEALTDMNGYFHIPSYSTLIGLNSRSARTSFIIFKPGYASYPGQLNRISPFKNCRNESSVYFNPKCRPAAVFGKKTGMVGDIYKDQLMTEKVAIQYGIVELPKVSTWEERRKACSTPGIGDLSSPILNQVINKEIEWIYSHQGWRR